MQFFGSTLFGGVDKDSDMDLLLLCFEDILNRFEFFAVFADFLVSDEMGATKLLKVPQAKIPILKFTFMNVEFDLLFCEVKPLTESESHALTSAKLQKKYL